MLFCCFHFVVVTVGMAHNTYIVEEDIGFAIVCVKLMIDSSECIVPFPFTVTFSTGDIDGNKKQ